MFSAPLPTPVLGFSAARDDPRARPSGPLLALAIGVLTLAGCSSGTEPIPPVVVDCAQAVPINLAVGEHTTIDASQTGCVRFPAAGPSGAEYLYAALSTQGKVSEGGTSVNYQLTGGPPGTALVASVSRSLLHTSRPSSRVQAFHRRLRILERQLSERPASQGSSAISASTAQQPPPVLGEQRMFNVLRNADSSGASADDYVQVTGTAKYIGSHAAIFLDDAAPSPGYTQADIDGIGAIFDDHLYPIDVTAFGSESDINGDNLVLVLLTDRVTKLANPQCLPSGALVVGFFFPIDLISAATGSNGAEIFYGLAPDPACNVLPAEAAELLPSVFIHEFQHMISYNQHVLVRDGVSEDTWLNEGLSTFAEELGGRQVPDPVCLNNDCATQFILGNLANAYSFLSDLESNYLVGADSVVPVPLTEYGAAWLFVRWLADHFSQTPTLGTDLTRSLVQTTNLGSDNVTAVTGEAFPTLVTQWQMANYLDNLPAFTPGNPRLQYDSWDFRQVYASLNQQSPGFFPLSYPLVPDNTNGEYTRSGTLRAGSGRHVLLVQQPSSGEVDFKLTGSDGINALPVTAQPRVGITRIR
jgi:hypothetical protein